MPPGGLELPCFVAALGGNEVSCHLPTGTARSGFPVEVGQAGLPRFGSRGSAPQPKAARRRRRALLMTDTEDRLMAAAAIMGLRRRPKKG